MTASDTVLRDYVPDPPGGLTDIDDAVAAAVTPSVVRPALGLLGAVPGPLAGVLRTGLDLLLSKVPTL
jgi:hypothetical protein